MVTDKAKLPVRHHYIPQMYLEGFSVDGDHLYTLDKKTLNSKVRFRYQTKNAIAYENHLYTYQIKDGTKETLEDFFCDIEGKAKTIIGKLSSHEQITVEDRSYFSLFLSYMWLRTPAFKHNSYKTQSKAYEQMTRMMYRFPQQKERMREFFEQRGNPMTDAELDDLIDFATNEKRSEIKLDIPQNYWIKQMLLMGNDLYPLIAMFDWEIYYTKQTFAFITSDNPFFLIPNRKLDPFEGLGLLTPGAKKIIPITSDMCLVMHEPSEIPRLVYTDANKDFFRKINLWVYKRAERNVFSPILGKIEKMYKQYGSLSGI